MTHPAPHPASRPLAPVPDPVRASAGAGTGLTDPLASAVSPTGAASALRAVAQDLARRRATGDARTPRHT
ncbi:hypothetical protein ABB07_38960 (plasmid) [Streptomyces incarnatus]|uniref:Uncharacterized protein n=1 Tax=Streptomyces incarnatus TaxID=665007 RepID=A0ABN4GVJ0_9ACTN|nr:hypothetical protein [Streptomyces incarnatus]AKJ15798.1 hypothetical protein ABB07_38960 [Streptomyces incarnatus]